MSFIFPGFEMLESTPGYSKTCYGFPIKYEEDRRDLAPSWFKKARIVS